MHKTTEFNENEIKHPFAETSTFEVMFPRHRETYIREIEAYLRKAMAQKKLSLSVDYHELVLSVSTTQKTRDPYGIISGRDVLKLISRGVPLAKAAAVLEDDVYCDIIQINKMVRNKDTFIKRRERLLGPYNNTIKSLELLTDCYILPYGNTVSAIGDYKKLKEVRRVVLRCMENIHPIYEIKRLMVKRELEKDPNLKNENWERYLPQYKKTHSKKTAASKQIAKNILAKKTPQSLVPDIEQRKMDKEIESGTYFTKSSRKERRKGKASTKQEEGK